MFNLLIGLNDSEIERGRLFEYTNFEHILPKPQNELGQLKDLEAHPALVMPEALDSRHQAIARVGKIEFLYPTYRGYRFRFTPDLSAPAIPIAEIQKIADRLDIRQGEFTRTHWAIKSGDLYQELFTWLSLKPKLFDFPVSEAILAQQVAIMMPFHPDFNPVYDAIKEAVQDAGMYCVRADDIWKKDKLLDEVIDLIYRSRVIISDLSGTNPNVFYETGIAHSIGRDTILISQRLDDVPFDLRHLRALEYLNNGEGLTQLRDEVTNRLKTVTLEDS